ncbi:hypothetical protein ACFSQ3_09090 [Sphingobacterium corticis]|uniref:Uncharacterized protein n=1 Tax=Sphingobacterium corticis TaxID=1812823 RepID=A0ABW5NMR5_9SPHI
MIDHKPRYRLFLIFLLAAIYTFQCHAQDSLAFKLHGGLRFNYVYSTWDQDQKNQGGTIAYDVFRINPTASYGNFTLDAEYRQYSSSFGGGFLKHGWIGYEFKDGEQLHVGLVSVPFGLQPVTGNSWFYNIGYYLGLEDNYDMGVRYSRQKERWDYDFAFIKNAETLDLGGDTELSQSRFAYDIVGRNKKVNQVNANVVYKTTGAIQQQIGLSGQLGGLYNIDTKKMGNHYAASLAYQVDYSTWNLKASFIHAIHNPMNAAGTSNQVMELGAYGSAYETATNFHVYTVGLAKNFSVNWKPMQALVVYHDFGYMQKHVKSFENSYMQVTGVRTNIGPIITYIDYATGLNHSWFGGNFVNDFSLGDPNAKRQSRFNINLGYYF